MSNTGAVAGQRGEAFAKKGFCVIVAFHAPQVSGTTASTMMISGQGQVYVRSPWELLAGGFMVPAVASCIKSTALLVCP